MSPEWSAGPSSATLLLVVGALGFVLGVAVGLMLAAARARRLREVPSRPANSSEFWRGDDRSRRVWAAAASDRPSASIERSGPSMVSPPSTALMPSMPPMASMEFRPNELPVDPFQTEIAPDPMASMTDAEIDAMAAEVPVRLPRRRRKPVSGPGHTVHRL